MTTEITIVLPVLNEHDNLVALLPRLRRVLDGLRCPSEVVVVDGGSRDGTAELARSLGARVIVQRERGYGSALREGFAAANSPYVLTLDADLSHEPDFIRKLWAARDRADIVIASRYVTGGAAHMPWHRKALSRILNSFFAIGLGLPVRDLSSGFRLYRTAALRELDVSAREFDVLEEILVKAYAAGWRVAEVPFTYFPRGRGSSHARIIKFGLVLLRTFGRLRTLRNSVASADYDERAFYSRIPLQRSWQRRRHRIITTLARAQGRTLDVGCGSSVILQSLNHAVGIDVQLPKLRYMRRYRVPLAQGSVFALPFRDAAFDCVICSQVIEHVPDDPVVLDELLRVLVPGGLLILGTPDYATICWRLIEPLYGFFAPSAYKDEHITHYTGAGLRSLAARRGLVVESQHYVYRSELILAMRKPPAVVSRLPEPVPVEAEAVAAAR